MPLDRRFCGAVPFSKIAEVSKAWTGSIALVFVMYAGIAVLAFVFGLRWLPETENKTLEEITAFWKKDAK